MAWKVWINNTLEAKLECPGVLGSIPRPVEFTYAPSLSVKDPKRDGFPLVQGIRAGHKCNAVSP